MSWLETDDGTVVELPGSRCGPVYRAFYDPDEPPEEPDPPPAC